METCAMNLIQDDYTKLTSGGRILRTVLSSLVLKSIGQTNDNNISPQELILGSSGNLSWSNIVSSSLKLASLFQPWHGNKVSTKTQIKKLKANNESRQLHFISS